MIDIKREDHEFLLSSTQFCNRIEEYATLFNLDASLINAYKSDGYLLNQLLTEHKYNGRGFEYFMARKIGQMKATFNYLVGLCKCSKNYTPAIGNYLGIEEDDDDPYSFSEN